MERKPFTWWWPSTSAGGAAFGVVLGVSSMTILAFGPFAIINVIFWYLVAVFVRFVYLHATGGAPGLSAAPPTIDADPDLAGFRRWRRDAGPATDSAAATIATWVVICLIAAALVVMFGRWD